MKHYDSFENIARDPALIGEQVWAFNKLDGQNFCAKYNAKKKYFSDFGSKKCNVDETSEMFGDAVKFFKQNIESKLIDVIKKNSGKKCVFTGVEEITFFFEWYGDNSFAGFHQEGDELRLAIIDVHLYKKGYIQPKDFYDMFKDSGIEMPDLIYQGPLNQEFIESIYNNDWRDPNCKYPTVKEGVVCKRSTLLKGQRLPKVKVKTKWWLDKIHEKFSPDLWKDLE